MGNSQTRPSALRTRWAAIGAAIAITLGAGGVGLVSATASSGQRLTFVAIDACRVIDIRPDFQIGPKSSPLGPEEVLTVSTHGSNGECAGIPTDAVALSLNVTALNATQGTFLAVWAAGQPQPNASSLNPDPGQPPIPNAVTTRLSPTGQFNIFNRVGFVNVFVDITGYYQDHNHDDRYDTKAEVDAKISAHAATGPTEVHYGMLDMEPFQAGTTWVRSIAYAHSATGSAECLNMPVDAQPGQSFTEITASYANGSGGNVSLNISVIGTRVTPGPYAAVSELVHSALAGSGSVAPTAAGMVDELVGATSTDRIARAGFRYAGLVCTDGDLTVTGATIRLTNP